MIQFNSGRSHRPNYELKAKVIADGLDKLQSKYSQASWWYYNAEEGEQVPDWVAFTEEELEEMYWKYENSEEWKEAYRVNNSKYHRVQRLKNRISSMLEEGGCVFVTLTFTDSVLENTSIETRKKYVTRALKTMSDTYVANIDYGSHNGREHYHAVVKADKVDHSLWHYGAINFKRIHNSETDCEKVAKYVAKLTNHAIKKTTKGNYMIYSREHKKSID